MSNVAVKKTPSKKVAANKTVAPDRVSPEQIEVWKAEYKDIFKISVEGRVGYLKKPGRKAIGYASSFGTKDPMKFNEVILNDSWLGGDEELRTDDELFMAVASKLGELVVFKTAELEKL